MNIPFLVARKTAGLTQEQLAERTGIRQDQISQIERGGWTPPPEQRERLVEVLGVDAEGLFPELVGRAS